MVDRSFYLKSVLHDNKSNYLSNIFEFYLVQSSD